MRRASKPCFDNDYHSSARAMISQGKISLSGLNVAQTPLPV